MQGVLNYVILRPLMTAVGVIAQLCGVYGDSSFRLDRVYIYITIINNLSQVWHRCRDAVLEKPPPLKTADRSEAKGKSCTCPL